MPQANASSLILAMPPPLTAHPAAVYLSGLGDGSQPTMRQALNTIAALLTDNQCDAMTLNWAALRYQHTAAIRTALIKQFAPATVNKMLCALRRVLKEAFRLDLIDAQSYAKAVDVPSVRVKTGLKGRALSTDEIAALMQVCLDDPTSLGARDAAMIAILRGAGLRRAEVVNLNLKDLNVNTGALEIRKGKGQKDRTVYLPSAAIDIVFHWLNIRGKSPGPLLFPIWKGGKIRRERMTAQSVLLIVRKRAAVAGVDTFSPHDFRRTFCSDLLDAGVDIVTVAQLAGHDSPMTTAKYDRRREQTKRRAVEQLQIPLTRNNF